MRALRRSRDGLRANWATRMGRIGCAVAIVAGIGAVEFASVRLKATTVLRFIASCGVSWIDWMKLTRSSIGWSGSGPPPARPQGGIGVPGRP